VSDHNYFITYFTITHSISHTICTILKENYSSTQASQKGAEANKEENYFSTKTGLGWTQPALVALLRYCGTNPS